VEDRGVMAAFMQALGFSAQQAVGKSIKQSGMTKEEPGSGRPGKRRNTFNPAFRVAKGVKTRNPGAYISK
jgi:hypothetical protein